jgi:flagellar basal-body rod protein FlgC
MSLITAINISSSGLTAQRARVENATSNVANAGATRTPEGGPYRRKDVVFETVDFDNTLSVALDNISQGVEVVEVVPDQTAFERRHDPKHPDADKDGYVLYPNVNLMSEMLDLASAARSYEANLSALTIAKALIARTLEIGK